MSHLKFQLRLRLGALMYSLSAFLRSFSESDSGMSSRAVRCGWVGELWGLLNPFRVEIELQRNLGPDFPISMVSAYSGVLAYYMNLGIYGLFEISLKSVLYLLAYMDYFVKVFLITRTFSFTTIIMIGLSRVGMI